MKNTVFLSRIKLLFMLIGFAAAQMTYADAVTTGKVTSVGTYGNGNLFIVLDTTISEPGCSSSSRFDVPSTNPEVTDWLALATTAFSSGTKRLVVHTSGCYQAYPGYFSPTLTTNGVDTYIYLTN